jgi:ABC-type uncharacterized transport system ATPase subunit
MELLQKINRERKGTILLTTDLFERLPAYSDFMLRETS